LVNFQLIGDGRPQWHAVLNIKAANMKVEYSLPVSARISLNLISIALIATGLYLGGGIFLPIFFSVLFAMLLHPIVNYLTTRKIDRVLAILSCIVLAFCIVGAVIYFLSIQIGSFVDDIPTLKARLNEIEGQVKQWVHTHMNIGIREQTQYINETQKKMSAQNGGLIQSTFVTLTELISYVIFLPVYTFLILYHKDMIKKFMIELFRKRQEDKIVEIMDESQYICQQYVMGMLIEFVIVFALNSTGFLVIGIKYPIFLALVAALLNVVPYIGMLIANVFCVIVTLVSSDSSINVLWVFGVLGAVQIIDNNILMPWIVGNKIRINAMAIIVGVVVGGTLCGVPGMFLAIPGLAIMKIVFERFEPLKPWAILLDDEVTRIRKFKNPLKAGFIRKEKTEEPT
jgi:predicted PurR-regulated permease PerM